MVGLHSGCIKTDLVIALNGLHSAGNSGRVGSVLKKLSRLPHVHSQHEILILNESKSSWWEIVESRVI